MRYVDAQFMLRLQRVQYWSALITSGAYKQLTTQQGTDEKSADGTIVFRDLTDDEKLQHALATMKRHIEIADDTAETIAEINQRDFGDCNKDK